MKRLNQWFDTASSGATFALFAGLWTLVRVVFSLIEGDFSWPLVVGDVIGGLVFGAIFAALFAFRRRRSGGATAFAAINRSLRSGELPEDADPAVWNPELARRERSFRRNQWMAPIIFGLFLVLSIVLALADPTPVLGIVCFVIFAGLLVFTLVMDRRYLARIASLKTQLGGVAAYHPTPTY